MCSHSLGCCAPMSDADRSVLHQAGLEAAQWCPAGEPAGGQPSIDVVEKLMRTDGRTDGLAPFYVDPANGALSGGILTLGARGDSYYEYMLKQWLLSGKQQQTFLR